MACVLAGSCCGLSILKNRPSCWLYAFEFQVDVLVVNHLYIIILLFSVFVIESAAKIMFLLEIDFFIFFGGRLLLTHTTKRALHLFHGLLISRLQLRNIVISIIRLPIAREVIVRIWLSPNAFIMVELRPFRSIRIQLLRTIIFHFYSLIFNLLFFSE